MTDNLDVLIGELRADVPAMSDEAFATGRARLVTATEPKDAVVIALPTATAPEDAMVIELPVRPGTPLPPNRRAPWLVAAALLVVAVASVVVVRGTAVDPAQPTPPSVIKDEGGLPPMPAKPLNDLGQLAVGVTEQVVPPGHYRYIRMEHESRAFRGGPPARSVQEIWLPAEVGQEMLVRTTEDGRPPQEHRSPRKDFAADPPLATTPDAQYRAMRDRLGTALDAPERARNELLIPLNSPYLGAVERRLRLATLSMLPKLDVRAAQLDDGTPAVLVSAVEYDGASRVEYYFDPPTGYVLETRSVDLTGAESSIGHEGTTRYSKPVVVAGIGIVP